MGGTGEAEPHGTVFRRISSRAAREHPAVRAGKRPARRPGRDPVIELVIMERGVTDADMSGAAMTDHQPGPGPAAPEAP
jgi:hypothetical protein